jgi:parallel beta-helix repeat protein
LLLVNYISLDRKFMKKIILLITLFVFSLGYSQALLQGFESGGIDGAPFGGMATPTIVTGTGSNTSQVLRIVGNTGAAEPWQGINLFLNPSINLTVNKTMTIDVLSSTPITFLVKVTTGGAIAAAPVTHNGDGTWQTLSFTFNTALDNQTADPSGTYSGFVIHAYWEVGRTEFFDPTVVPTPARTFYVDNIREPAPAPPVTGDVYINDNSLVGDIFTSAVGQNIGIATGSTSLPYKSITDLFSDRVISPGATIHVDSGTYTGRTILQDNEDGISGSVITIKGAGSGLTTLNSTLNNDAVIKFNDADYFTVEDMTISSATEFYQIWTTPGSTNCTFNNLVLVNTKSATQGWTIVLQGSFATITNNVITSNYVGIDALSGSSNTTIIGNKIFGNNATYGIWFQGNSTTHSVFNNMVSNFKQAFRSDGTTTSNCNLYNNSFSGTEFGCVGYMAGWNVKNNIFSTSSNNAGDSAFWYGGAQPPATLDHNLYYHPNAARAVTRFNSAIYATLADFVAANPSYEANGVEGNPLFVSTTDLHLSAGSPAIGAGTDVGITDDIDGDARPLSGSFDIGADEFITTVTPGVINWTGVTNSDWNTPTNWDTGFVPGPTDIVNILNVANDPTAAGAISVASMSIESGASFIANAAVTGDVTYERNLSTSNWYYISSPVAGQNVDAFVTSLALETQASFRSFCTFDTVINNWVCYENASTFVGNFINGKGYIVNLLGASGTISFTGTMNVADVAITLDTTGSRYNLLGNPYTSFIDTAAILSTSSAFISTETLYVFDAANNSYVVYVTADNFQLAPGQAFFIQSNGVPGNIAINEAFQSHQDPDTFLRSADRTEVYLTLSDDSKTRNCRLYYIAGTTTGFDNGYDGPMFRAFADPFSIYTHLVTGGNGTDIGVQSLPNDDYENLVVPIGVTVAAGNEFTISASSINFPDGVDLYLEDRDANTFTLLNANSDFTLTTTSSLNGVGRFYLHTSSSTLGFNDNDLASDLHIYTTATTSELIIKGQLSGATNAKLYTIEGKLLLSKALDQFIDSNVLDVSGLSSGVYVVKVDNANHTKTQKVIIK